MSDLRWKLWEWASWLAWWLCPDKNALALIMKHGTITSLAVMAELARQRTAKGDKP